ncbi:SDR family NAD(P)-dependent oxidoreductase [Streptomyces sp. NPDC046197]|uniref:SDR family NAD(P)-dependent oxidoreductase n=1 Tax=Streptomyces sp. NPDC046197 TaxID=3154337 RepID=UPI0033F21DA8
MAQPAKRMLTVNLQGLLHVTHAALPHLLRAAEDSPRRVADLVNIRSTAGRVARPGTAVHSMTKFGVNGFTEALRQEVMRQRVRVSVVEPGTVNTEFVTHSRDEIRASPDQQLAGMEMLRPEDIADAVAFVVTRDRRVSSTRSSSAPPIRPGETRYGTDPPAADLHRRARDRRDSRLTAPPTEAPGDLPP